MSVLVVANAATEFGVEARFNMADGQGASKLVGMGTAAKIGIFVGLDVVAGLEALVVAETSMTATLCCNSLVGSRVMLVFSRLQ